MRYDEQEQTPPEDENNQPTETSWDSGITQTSTDTRKGIGCQVHVDT